MRGPHRAAKAGAGLVVMLLLALSGSAAAAGPAALERQLGSGVNVSGGAETGAGVTFLGTDPGVTIPLSASAPRAAALEAAARFAPSFGLRDDAGLTVAGVDRVADGRAVVELQQTLGGLPVIGGELKVNLDPGGDLLSLGGELTPSANVDAGPRVGEAAAAEAARAWVARKHAVSAGELSAGAGELSVYDPRILGAPGPLGPRTVWRFEVRDGDPVSIRELVLVDAELGNVALAFSEIHEAKNRRVCDANSANAKVPCTAGLAARSEGAGATGIADVDAAYDLTGGVYDFFQAKFGRDSIDGEGMPVISTVRFCESGCPYENAFWNGEQMVYGTGLLTEDISGHELAHGVVEFESHLFYYYQSGAINESLADVFGELFDLSAGTTPPGNPDRWKIGEGSSIGVIRNMANPPEFGDPDRMGSSNWYFDPETDLSGTGDSGGVHHNSGVNNKAAFLLTDGGSFNGQTVGALGAEKMLQIYYEVNANLLTSAGDYQDLGNALRQACANLTGEHGIAAADCAEVNRAVLATEMDNPPAAPEAAPRKAATCAPGEAAQDAFFDDLESPSGKWTISNEILVNGEGGFFYPQNSHPFAGFDATYATSGTTNIWGYDFPLESDSRIAMTQSVAVPAAGWMHFKHAFGFESEEFGDGFVNYDGGVVEYSTDGGGTWQDAGGLIATGATYTGVIASAFGNPLGGRSAFTGESGGYGSTRLDLGSLAGQEIRFRFRIGTDEEIDDYGWFIDDVRIYRCEGETDPGTDPGTQTDPQSQPGSSPAPSPVPAAVAPPQPPAATQRKPKPKKCRRNQRKVRVKVKGKTRTKCVRRKGKAGKRRR